MSISTALKFLPMLTMAALSYDTCGQQSSKPSKSKFHLFNPTPKNLMRGFETDRPDMTESPLTVDAGHFQIETDLAKTTFNKASGEYIHAFNVPNMKVGLTNSTDLQLIFTSYAIEQNNKSDLVEHKAFSDFTIRIKQNLIGNDRGNFALGIIPFVNFPNSKSNPWSGGIIFPVATSIGKWGLGGQVEADFVAVNANNIPITLQATTSVSYSILERVSVFLEQMTSRNPGGKSWQHYLNGGLVVEVIKNVKIDIGTYHGIESSVPTSYFLGLSVRY